MDRPLAYYLKQQIERSLSEASADGLEGYVVRVVADIRWIHDEPLQALPTISLGGPGVNALAERWLEEVPVSLAFNERYFIQMDPDLTEPHVSIWGMDNSTTQIAVSVFVNRFLPRFLDRCATIPGHLTSLEGDGKVVPSSTRKTTTIDGPPRADPISQAPAVATAQPGPENPILSPTRPAAATPERFRIPEIPDWESGIRNPLSPDCATRRGDSPEAPQLLGRMLIFLNAKSIWCSILLVEPLGDVARGRSVPPRAQDLRGISESRACQKRRSFDSEGGGGQAWAGDDFRRDAVFRGRIFINAWVAAPGWRRMFMIKDAIT